MNILFLEPHTSDFVYRPTSFFLARKKALNKYKYLSEFPWAGLAYTGRVTSLPKRMYGGGVNKIFSFVDFFIFRYINDIKKIKCITEYDLSSLNIFMFGYKNSERTLDYLLEAGFSNRVYIHLSHYHTFNIDKKYFEKLDIVFCFDNDIKKVEYFRRKYPEYAREVEQIPFEIGARFFEKKLPPVKKLDVVSVGTYHKLPLGSLDINCDGYSTLHPLRLEFSMNNWPSFVNSKLTKYDSDSGVLKKVFFGQRKYFRYNMVDLLAHSSHVFVGKEGTGAVAIGSLEAMACGSVVFLSNEEKGTLLFEDADVIYFENFKDLKEKILHLDLDTEYPASELNRSCARAYSRESLLINAKKVFLNE